MWYKSNSRISFIVWKNPCSLSQCQFFFHRKNRRSTATTSCHASAPFYAEEVDKNGDSLTTLIPDIEATTRIVEVSTSIFSKLQFRRNPFASVASPEKTVTNEKIEDVYLRIMKKFQFGSCLTITFK